MKSLSKFILESVGGTEFDLTTLLDNPDSPLTFAKNNTVSIDIDSIELRSASIDKLKEEHPDFVWSKFQTGGKLTLNSQNIDFDDTKLGKEIHCASLVLYGPRVSNVDFYIDDPKKGSLRWKHAFNYTDYTEFARIPDEINNVSVTFSDPANMPLQTAGGSNGFNGLTSNAQHLEILGYFVRGQWNYSDVNKLFDMTKYEVKLYDVKSQSGISVPIRSIDNIDPLMKASSKRKTKILMEPPLRPNGKGLVSTLGLSGLKDLYHVVYGSQMWRGITHTRVHFVKKSAPKTLIDELLNLQNDCMYEPLTLDRIPQTGDGWYIFMEY